MLTKRTQGQRKPATKQAAKTLLPSRASKMKKPVVQTNTATTKLAAAKTQTTLARNMLKQASHLHAHSGTGLNALADRMQKEGAGFFDTNYSAMPGMLGRGIMGAGKSMLGAGRSALTGAGNMAMGAAMAPYNAGKAIGTAGANALSSAGGGLRSALGANPRETMRNVSTGAGILGNQAAGVGLQGLAAGRQGLNTAGNIAMAPGRAAVQGARSLGDLAGRGYQGAMDTAGGALKGVQRAVGKNPRETVSNIAGGAAQLGGQALGAGRSALNTAGNVAAAPYRAGQAVGRAGAEAARGALDTNYADLGAAYGLGGGQPGSQTITPGNNWKPKPPPPPPPPSATGAGGSQAAPAPAPISPGAPLGGMGRPPAAPPAIAGLQVPMPPAPPTGPTPSVTASPQNTALRRQAQQAPGAEVSQTASAPTPSTSGQNIPMPKQNLPANWATAGQGTGEGFGPPAAPGPTPKGVGFAPTPDMALPGAAPPGPSIEQGIGGGGGAETGTVPAGPETNPTVGPTPPDPRQEYQQSRIADFDNQLATATDPRQRATSQRNKDRLLSMQNQSRMAALPAYTGGTIGGRPTADVMAEIAAKRSSVSPKFGSYRFVKQSGPLDAIVRGARGLWSGAKGLAAGAKNLPGVSHAMPAAKSVQKAWMNPTFQRWGVRPAWQGLEGMAAGGLADYAAHETTGADTNFSSIGGWGGLLGGLGHAGIGAKGRRFLAKNITGPASKAVVPLTGGKTVGGITNKVAPWLGMGGTGTAAAVGLGTAPLTMYQQYDEQTGKPSYNPFSFRDRVKRTGENAAIAKGDEMARGFGFKSLAELQKHPIGQGLKGWNEGGIGGAISGAWGAMSPEEQTRLISGLAGGVGLLGGGALALGGHPYAGAGLGALGAAGLGYGAFGPRTNPGEMINRMNPGQQQELLNAIPSNMWDRFTRPQEIDALQHAQGVFDQRLQGRNEFAGAQQAAAG